MSAVATVGLDLAKHVFKVHAVDVAGRVVTTRAHRRKDVLTFFEALPCCLIGLEACGSAHHWARELTKFGHDVRLMPPAYVKAYVPRRKNDAADAAAICEAVTRPSMRFVPVRSIENQAGLMHHKVRELLVAQRTQLLNALRSHLAEIGIIAAQGPNNARALAKGNDMIPAAVSSALLPLVHQLTALDDVIRQSDQAIMALAKADETARRLMTVPGIGPVTASALVASVQDISAFSGPREFAAFLGLTPRQNSSGGKDGWDASPKTDICASLLVVGAHAVLFHRRRSSDALRSWADRLLEAKPFKLVAVATANKLARIVFALMRDVTHYAGTHAGTPA
ncbi:MULTISPECIES: IS110 family transposase [unclassified Mesorhizobium]|uniref:IS110 family transposase n=1 Tax=unclassified Mesorhizobium TaxID=325217 RepID=UPI00333C391D